MQASCCGMQANAKREKVVQSAVFPTQQWHAFVALTWHGGTSAHPLQRGQSAWSVLPPSHCGLSLRPRLSVAVDGTAHVKFTCICSRGQLTQLASRVTSGIAEWLLKLDDAQLYGCRCSTIHLNMLTAACPTALCQWYRRSGIRSVHGPNCKHDACMVLTTT
jgi:hypothetical protein